MTNDQVTSVNSWCERVGLPLPNPEWLRTRQWRRVLAPRWMNWSLDRWMLFGALSEFMIKDEYVDTLSFLWSHSEGDLTFAHVEVIFTRYNHLGLSARDFMSAAEFDSWPETIEIYRGCNELTRDGVSWTRKMEVARNFARFRGARESPTHTGIVRTGECCKTDVLCYIQNEMGEYEVLVKPERVKILREEEIRLNP